MYTRDMLDERQEHILDFVIRDYIKTAVPVSSLRVAKKGKCEGSSATIRNIMMDLDGEGYLYQPHTSAGRAPTEKAYRYFVDNLLYDAGNELRNSQRERVAPEFNLASVVADFAKEIKVFASAATYGENTFHELAGFKDILKEPEFHNEEMLENFGDMVDKINEVAESYRAALIKEDDFYDVWIGKENLYPQARLGSALAARINCRDGTELFFFTFGPQRMNYEKAILKIKNLIQNI